MLRKFAPKLFTRFTAFVFMFLFGVVSFNLYHLNDKLEMLKTVNAFHQGQISNNKKLIDYALSDDFIETGVKFSAATPDAVYKENLLNFDYSELNILIEEKYLLPLNLLSNNDTSLSFVRQSTLLTESEKPFSVSFYVTYTFEKTADELKIVKIERKL